MAFLRGQAEAIGLECRVVEPLPGKPVVVMTWPGTEPALPTLLLNSHTDVVPVFEVGGAVCTGVIAWGYSLGLHIVTAMMTVSQMCLNARGTSGLVFCASVIAPHHAPDGFRSTKHCRIRDSSCQHFDRRSD